MVESAAGFHSDGWNGSLRYQFLKTTKVLLDYQADADILVEVREKLSRNEDAIYDLHVWSIAPGKYGVIAGIAPESPRCPDDYRNRLDQERFPHITVEINRYN